MNNLRILGSGYSVPSSVVENDDFKVFMDTSDEWISTRTGIKRRHIAKDETTFSLAYDAAKKAILNANINPEEIDLVVVASITPDSITPSTACQLLEPLGIMEAMAFDLNAACSGFVYAINTSLSLMQANGYRKALVIGAEEMSKLMDFNKRDTAVLFGDGAGAIVIEASGKEASFYCKAKTDSSNMLEAKGIVKNGLFNNMINDNYLSMDGKAVFKFALEAVLDGINKVLEKGNLTINDIDHIIPHQANKRIIASIARKLEVDMDKFYINIDEFGNTSAASIAIALAEGIEKNILRKGQKVLLIGFGAGLTWASMILEI